MKPQYKNNAMYSFFDIWNPEYGFNIDEKKLEYGDIIETAVFREGKFKHLWYGDLDFTGSYIDDMIANYDRGITGYCGSVNLDHLPTRGAYGWLVEEKGSLFSRVLKVRTDFGEEDKKFLFARWMPTRECVDLINDKKYRFFSAEIMGKYRSRETQKAKDKEGNEIDVQVERKGPIFTGFALTNHPFIPNLPGLFSVNGGPSDREGLITEDVYTNSGSGNIFYFNYPRDEEEIKNESSLKSEDHTDSVNVSFSDDNISPDEEKDMKLNDFFQKYAEVAADPSKAKDYLEQVFSTSTDEELRQTAKQMLMSVNATLEAQKAAREAAARIELAQADAERLRNEKAELSNQLNELGHRTRKNEVALFAQELENQNIPLPVVKKVREQLAALDSSQYSLSLNVGDKSLSLHDFLKEILLSIPKANRIDESEQTSANSTDEPGNTDLGNPETKVEPAPQKTEVHPALLAFCEEYDVDLNDLDEDYKQDIVSGKIFGKGLLSNNLN